VNYRNLFLSVLFGLTCVFAIRADVEFAGVNLSGGEFGQTVLPGTYGLQYTYPTTGEVDYYKGKGMNIIRLPFRWERLQHTNSATLNPAELIRMNNFVSYATSKGVFVILDPHNFERYYPDTNNFESSTTGLVGSAVPDSDFTNFWGQVANIYKTNSHVIFGLNNEPNTMPTEQLVTSENAAIAAIRGTGATNLIFVPGNAWTGAWTWPDFYSGGATPNAIAMLNIVDSGNNYVYEVHQYLDNDGSGSNDGIVSADIGWQRLTNFTAWARANNFKAFLGEYAVPGNTIGGTGLGGAALTNMLSYVQTNSDVWLGWTYWGGGPWWGSSPTFPIEPANIGLSSQQDQPVMDIIKQFFPLPSPQLQMINSNQFQFLPPQGFVYQLQSSPDLVNWANLGSATTNVPPPGSSANPPMTVNMTIGAGSQGFYRVKVTHAP
jgi:endoglucanase